MVLIKDRSPEIWLFQPKGSTAVVKEAIRAICRKREWRFEQYSTIPRSLFDRGRYISVHVLNSQQATKLYVRIHRKSVGIVQFDDAYVPVTPSPKSKDYVSLDEFVKYKAFYGRIDPSCLHEQQADVLARGLEDWIALPNRCEGENDPRCLPLHVFRPRPNNYDLNSQSGRQRFNKDHGAQSSRRDDNELLWNRPHGSGMHGGQELQISGRNNNPGIPLGCFCYCKLEGHQESVEHEGYLED